MYVYCNIVTRSRNVYTSSAILTAWYFTRRQHLYSELVSPVTMEHIQVFEMSDILVRFQPNLKFLDRFSKEFP